MTATPRPWKVADRIFVVGPKNRGVLCAANPKASDAESEANAELIVRAVNMLDVMEEAQAALTLSLDTMRGMTDYFEDGLEKAMLDRTVKECKAALARMEGTP